MRVLAALACFLPHRMALRLGSLLGLFMFHILRYRRQVTFYNLSRAFPNLSMRERFSIARKTYQNLGRTFFEAFRVPKMGKKILRYIRFVGEDKISKCLSKGKGVIGLCMHYDNWELLGAALCARGFPLCAAMRRLHNPRVNEYMVRSRARCGIRLFHLEEGLSRQVLSLLMQNKFVSFINDQNAGSAGFFVDFLGVKASFFRGAALFAVRRQLDAIMCTIVRERDGLHHTVFVDHFPPPHKSAEAFTQKFVERYSYYIRRDPTQYLWTHRRFKNTA